MSFPTLAQAQQLLAEAETLNPGPWMQHSIYVARAAEQIAFHHPELDAERAFVLAYLHDIGRYSGPGNMRHVIDGYRFLMERGYDDPARIALTHSFPVKHPDACAGQWDCPPADYEFVRDYLAQIEYTKYDRLIQLCDALALPTGFCLLEKRFVDVTLRYGFNDFTLARWQSYLAIKQAFEAEIGRSIYTILPGIVENTFGFGG
jgi:putative nucleotidyltransferase with HDIG domain